MLAEKRLQVFLDVMKSAIQSIGLVNNSDFRLYTGWFSEGLEEII